MVIWESFDLCPQNRGSWFLVDEEVYEIRAGIPVALRARVDCCEDIEEVLNVYIL